MVNIWCVVIGRTIFGQYLVCSDWAYSL